MCPKGIDPLTSYSEYRTITLTTHSDSGTLAGQLKFTFNGEYIYLPANAKQMTSSQCTKYFQTLPNIGEVKCGRNKPDTRGGALYEIQLRSFPAVPHENNIYFHSGNPPLSSFTCDTSLVTGTVNPTCVLADIVTTSIPGS
jgi:hypothetical protein